MVFGTGPKAGNALVTHPDVPLVSFTGGTKTGEILQKVSTLPEGSAYFVLGGSIFLQEVVIGAWRQEPQHHI